MAIASPATIDKTPVSIRSVDADYPATIVELRSDTCRAVLTDLGARLLEMHVPDRNGDLADVVLGRPTIHDALCDPNYMGATAGRFANRIRHGRFTLDSRPYQVSVNEGSNHLHGGLRGFDRFAWSTRVDPERCAVEFSRISPAGEEGFPGEVLTRTTYRLEGATLHIEMVATTTEPTLVNLVHHSYWNLGGHDSGTVLDHIVGIDASHYTPVDDELLPLGTVAAVRDTPFDFRRPRPIRDLQDRVHNTGAGRVSGPSGGYDHNWVLGGQGHRKVAIVTDPASGRSLHLYTNQPGLHLYTGGYLNGVTAKAPLDTYPAYAGLTLETQTPPDSINHPHFPQAVLQPGQTYRNTMTLQFSCT